MISFPEFMTYFSLHILCQIRKFEADILGLLRVPGCISFDEIACKKPSPKGSGRGINQRDTWCSRQRENKSRDPDVRTCMMSLRRGKRPMWPELSE